MIHKIQRFGSKYDDFGGVAHNLSVPEFRLEIENVMDDFFYSEITYSESGFYWVDLFIGPCRSWKYRIVTNDLNDVSFIKLKIPQCHIP